MAYDKSEINYNWKILKEILMVCYIQCIRINVLKNIDEVSKDG